MTKEQLYSVIEKYEITLEYELDAVAQECDHKLIQTERQVKLDHLASMLPKMYEMCKNYDDEQSRAKLYRWLGFMQGVLWSENVFCLEDLRSDNKNGADNSQFNVVSS